MKKKLNSLVVDAFCPHCKKSFVKKGVIVNFFKRNDGDILKLEDSIIPGNYNKKILDDLDNKIILEEKELVLFFCQYCDKNLNLKENENVFLMGITTKDGAKMEAIRSALYGEEFTAILDENKKYWFGNTSEEKVREMDKFIGELQAHYAKGLCFIP